MIQKIDHAVITTKNLSACIAFYEKLGFTSRDAGGRHELFAGDFKINVHSQGAELSPHALHVQTGSADLCFELSCSLQSFQAMLMQNAIEIELGVVGRSGARGAMQSVYIRDLDGNLLEFCSYA